VFDWTECPPQELGVAPDRLAAALELVRSRGGTAQLVVLKDGRVLLDRSFGCAPDALFWTFSATKPFIALLVHLLAQRGELSLDDPVARSWPGFGARGKDGVTVRQVLQHRSGLSSARGMLVDALVMADWDRSLRALERAGLQRAPGSAPAYQPIAYGFILGEVVRRVAGAPPDQLLRREFLDPLGLADLHLGLPDELWHRHVPLRGSGPAGRITQGIVNRRATRRAVIPAAGVSTTARDLARFYQVLLDGGVRDGVRVLDPATVLEARRRSTAEGEIDLRIKRPVRWAQGFQLGGLGTYPGGRPVMGRLSTPETFGHNGSSCCIGWADPTRRLVFGYLTDVLPRGREGSHHLSTVADAVLAACDNVRSAPEQRR
jgi:CubicO group peptidase (beta-lactamase class C family)